MFPMSQQDLQGYDPGQVDALMSRIKKQYEVSGRSLVTSSVVTLAKFDFTIGGYQIGPVDSTLAKLADTLEAREIAERVVRSGKSGVFDELNDLLSEISKVLDQRPKKRFSSQKKGYSKALVHELLNSIRVVRGNLISPSPLEIRTMQLGSARSGLSRHEVNAFCDLVAGAAHRQLAIG